AAFSEEEAIDRRIKMLEEELKLLFKKKEAFRVGTQEDVSKLLGKRRTLARLESKRKSLGDNLSKIMEDSEVAKKCKHALEDMHASAIEAAQDLECFVLE
ncbi:hypothetical protein A2U01_0065986, partial [Trifolium medium]|nr:hypothetical protein [Trifolium medium]